MGQNLSLRIGAFCWYLLMNRKWRPPDHFQAPFGRLSFCLCVHEGIRIFGIIESKQNIHDVHEGRRDMCIYT
jgi:hypothetical protein